MALPLFEMSDVYDSYGFRSGTNQSVTGEQTPQIVLQNRVKTFFFFFFFLFFSNLLFLFLLSLTPFYFLCQCHKWQRVLDTFSATPKSRVEALVYEGVPDEVRPQVWTALIRSSSQVQKDLKKKKSFKSFFIYLFFFLKSKARENNYRKLLMMPDNKSVEQIKLDLARTLTHHRMFEEKNGEGQQKLLRVLKAYSYFNTTVGYCQGMSYLAAILLTVLPEEEAFHGMCVVVGGMEGYFVPTMWELLEDGKIFKNILAEQMPDLHSHLQDNGILPLMFICKKTKIF